MLVSVLFGVHAAHRGAEALGHDVTDDRDAVVHVVDEEPTWLDVLRPVLEELDGHLGYEAEGALVADDDVADVGARRSTGDVLDPADRAVGEDRLEADDHVLDAAIKRRQLPGRTGGGQTAHLGKGFDWGECPVVRPWARTASSSTSRHTPH